MPTVTLVGADWFRGWTREGAELVLAEGESADVSAETAAQLAEDHGHWFSIDGEPPADPPAPAAAEDEELSEEDVRAALLKMRRPALEEIAASYGLDGPSFQNKTLLVDAILEAAEPAQPEADDGAGDSGEPGEAGEPGGEGDDGSDLD